MAGRGIPLTPYKKPYLDGRTGTPERPMHRSQQLIRIGYTELVLQLVLTIYGPAGTFLELLFPWVEI